MPCFSQYEVIIFDCDGVILDSNNMKISAMRSALEISHYPIELIDDAVTAFKNNFGKSRFYHSQFFVEELLGLQGKKSIALQESILEHYSQAVEDEYLQVPITDGFLPFLDTLKNKSLYVASGSEEEQLIRVFQQRNLADFFKGIFGSPQTKSINVKNIINKHPNVKTLFVGDAVADYNAARENNIDFVFYSPYSNVKETMLEMSISQNFPVIHSYESLL